MYLYSSEYKLFDTRGGSDCFARLKPIRSEWKYVILKRNLTQNTFVHIVADIVGIGWK